MSRWGDLNSRIKAGIALLAIALFCVWFGGIPYSLLVAAACVVLAFEWATMCGFGAARVTLALMMLVPVAASVAAGTGRPAIGLALVALGTIAAAVVADRTAPRGARAALELATGVPYIGLAAVALCWLRADPIAGLANTLFALSIVWASDIGAYMVGRLVGGPKLAPAISPGKTWSGAAGGLACAVLVGVAVAYCFSSGISPSHVAELAAALGIVSQAGDLLESAVKRRFGVKDSGRVIPGHGGLLDRTDALLAVAPVAALLAFHVGRGVVLWR